MGECLAYGLASGFKCILAGGVDIAGNGADRLNVLVANLSKMNCFNFGMFSGIGANGN